MNDPLVGTTYDGRYRIARRIGAGGMANVYLAEDETLGRRVAIKVLHQRYAEDSQFIERFLREASAAARLNHPNIVQVYDRGQAQQSYYIAMEYVDGMTLKELVQRRGGLTEQEVLAYARQGLHALRFAHRNGIVHRDVKPHNMMVDTDGRLKIADFGIARAGADSGLTEAGSIVGTAQYLSPEQAQGHDVSATSDLYSLGVTMYEMATGRVPFDGDSPVNVALQHVKDPVPRPSSIKGDVSPALESIILKAMEKDPAHRYASADEMLADLDRAREGTTTQAMTQVLGGAALGAGATRVTPITPAAVPISSRVYEQPVPPEPAWPGNGWDDDEPDAARRSPWRWLLPLLLVLLLAGGAAYFLLVANRGVEVPDVVGQPAAQARADITDAGFVVGTVSTDFSEDIAQGLVVSTDPDGGTKADKGSKVDLVVSKGVAPLEVPDEVGKARQAAVDDLKGAGFVPTFSPAQPSDTVDKGHVISQTPPAGSKLAKGETVTMVLSSGPKAQTVPDVTGMSFEDASAKLTADPFTFDVKRKDADSEQPTGTVIAMDPKAGANLAAGETVTLTVSTGVNEVPDVVGMSRNDAVQELQGAGFDANVVTEGTDDPAKIGVVLSTDPSSGQKRDVGSTIDVHVGEAIGDTGGGTPAPVA